MLNDKKVWASLPSTDLERSREFYQDKLGLKLVSENSNMLYFGSGGDTGLSLYTRGPSLADHTVATWSVDDIETEMSELREAGIVFEEYDMPDLKTEDGLATMDDTRAAWFKDPDENILGIFEM